MRCSCWDWGLSLGLLVGVGHIDGCFDDQRLDVAIMFRRFRVSIYFPQLQEAQKRMVIKRPPNVLLLHLKRFKYTEHLGRIKKLPYR